MGSCQVEFYGRFGRLYSNSIERFLRWGIYMILMVPNMLSTLPDVVNSDRNRLVYIRIRVNAFALVLTSSPP